MAYLKCGIILITVDPCMDILTLFDTGLSIQLKAIKNHPESPELWVTLGGSERVWSAWRDREATQETAPDWQHAVTLIFLKAATVTWYFTGTAMDMGWLSK